MTRLSPRPIPSRPEQSESAFIPPRPVWRADLEHLILSSPPPTRSPARGQTRGHDERHDAHSLGSGQSTRRSAPSTPAPAPRRLAAPPHAPAPRGSGSSACRQSWCPPREGVAHALPHNDLLHAHGARPPGVSLSVPMRVACHAPPLSPTLLSPLPLPSPPPPPPRAPRGARPAAGPRRGGAAPPEGEEGAAHAQHFRDRLRSHGLHELGVVHGVSSCARIAEARHSVQSPRAKFTCHHPRASFRRTGGTISSWHRRHITLTSAFRCARRASATTTAHLSAARRANSLTSDAQSSRESTFSCTRIKARG